MWKEAIIDERICWESCCSGETKVELIYITKVVTGMSRCLHVLPPGGQFTKGGEDICYK